MKTRTPTKHGGSTALTRTSPFWVHQILMGNGGGPFEANETRMGQGDGTRMVDGS